MASSDELLELDYDTESDVLYASIGAPKSALSYEVMDDVLLRYIPPSTDVVGVTIINFSEHYPIEDRSSLFPIARAIVEDLLRKYPHIPQLREEERSVNPQAQPRTLTVMIQFDPVSWMPMSVGTSVGIHAEESTIYHRQQLCI